MKYRTGLTAKQVKRSITYHKKRLAVQRVIIDTYECGYDSYSTLMTLKARAKAYYHEMQIDENEALLNYLNSKNN